MQFSMLVQYKADIVLIIFIVTCSRHDIAKNKCSFDVKQQALNDYKRDVKNPNKIQTRTCTCLHDDDRGKQSMA
jgi:hypothetical protein